MYAEVCMYVSGRLFKDNFPRVPRVLVVKASKVLKLYARDLCAEY